MKTMKRTVLQVSFLTVLSLALLANSGCKKDKEKAEEVKDFTAIQGAPGNPRFNLQFANGTANDVDLYVKTPNGSVISFSNPAAQNGKLDVDCLCNDCPNGPNENIYWTEGSAPRGTYSVWAQYYDPCSSTSGSSNYTLRIMKNSDILQTYTGTVSTSSRKSPVYTFTY